MLNSNDDKESGSGSTKINAYGNDQGLGTSGDNFSNQKRSGAGVDEFGEATRPNEYGTSDSNNTAYGAQTGDYGKSDPNTDAFTATRPNEYGTSDSNNAAYGAQTGDYGKSDSKSATQSGLQDRTGSYGSPADYHGSKTVTQSGLQQENFGATGLGTTAGGYGTTTSKYDDNSTSSGANAGYGGATSEYGTASKYDNRTNDQSYGDNDPSYGGNDQKPSTKDKIVHGAHKVIDKIVHPHGGSNDREDGSY